MKTDLTQLQLKKKILLLFMVCNSIKSKKMNDKKVENWKIVKEKLRMGYIWGAIMSI